jgi:hypothetical protein
MFLFRKHKYGFPYDSIEQCKNRIIESKEGDLCANTRYEIRMSGDKFQIFRCHPCVHGTRSSFNLTLNECIEYSWDFSEDVEYYIEF